MNLHEASESNPVQPLKEYYPGPQFSHQRGKGYEMRTLSALQNKMHHKEGCHWADRRWRHPAFITDFHQLCCHGISRDRCVLGCVTQQPYGTKIQVVKFIQLPLGAACFPDLAVGTPQVTYKGQMIFLKPLIWAGLILGLSAWNTFLPRGAQLTYF